MTIKRWKAVGFAEFHIGDEHFLEFHNHRIIQWMNSPRGDLSPEKTSAFVSRVWSRVVASRPAMLLLLSGRSRTFCFQMITTYYCVCLVVGQRRQAKILRRRILPGGTVEVRNKQTEFRSDTSLRSSCERMLYILCGDFWDNTDNIWSIVACWIDCVHSGTARAIYDRGRCRKSTSPGEELDGQFKTLLVTNMEISALRSHLLQ